MAKACRSHALAEMWQVEQFAVNSSSPRKHVSAERWSDGDLFGGLALIAVRIRRRNAVDIPLSVQCGVVNEAGGIQKGRSQPLSVTDICKLTRAPVDVVPPEIVTRRRLPPQCGAVKPASAGYSRRRSRGRLIDRGGSIGIREGEGRAGGVYGRHAVKVRLFGLYVCVCVFLIGRAGVQGAGGVEARRMGPVEAVPGGLV